MSQLYLNKVSHAIIRCSFFLDHWFPPTERNVSAINALRIPPFALRITYTPLEYQDTHEFLQWHFV